MDLRTLITRQAPKPTGTSRRAFLKTPARRPGPRRRSAPASASRADEPQKYGGDGMPHGLQDSPKIFVSIAPDGTVSIVVHRSEMGQGVRTSLPRIVADELEADYKRVRVVQAPGDEVKYGNQDTDGSRSTRHWFEPMRRCGAAARQMLEQAAANRWHVPVDQVEAQNHQVVHKPSGRKLGLRRARRRRGQARRAGRATSLKLKDPSKFRYIGKNDTDAHRRAGHRHRQVAVRHRHAPARDALRRRRASAGAGRQGQELRCRRGDEGAGRRQGVRDRRHAAAFGIHARRRRAWSWARTPGRRSRAARRSRSTGTTARTASYDSEASAAELEAAVKKPGGKVVRNEGDAYAALASAAKKFEADYYVPHYAHATMECPAATARIVNGACEVWAPSQSPQAARDRVAKSLNLSAEKVTVNVTLLGGGFGRKSKADFVCRGGAGVEGDGRRAGEADVDARRRPAQRLLPRGVGAASGSRPRCQRQGGRLAAPRGGADDRLDLRARPEDLAPFELGLGLTGMPYQIPNVRIENPEAVAHTRIGWLRSVNNIQHAFAAQSFIAEIAQAHGKDHRDYLLELLGPDRLIDPRKISEPWNHGESPERYPINTGRLRKVIERVTAGGRTGAASCRRGRGSGSRRTTASSATWRRWWRSRVDAEGRARDSARRHRGRLRAADQSRPRSLADRGRLRDGPEPGDR